MCSFFQVAMCLLKLGVYYCLLLTSIGSFCSVLTSHTPSSATWPCFWCLEQVQLPSNRKHLHVFSSLGSQFSIPRVHPPYLFYSYLSFMFGLNQYSQFQHFHPLGVGVGEEIQSGCKVSKEL